MEISSQINKQFGRIKDDAIIKSLTKDLSNPDDVLCAYASVEIVDTVGDVVVIDGIDWSTYHNPPDRYLKVLAGHWLSLENGLLPTGEPPIIGRVEQFLKTAVNVDGAPTPALAFAMTWAKDGDGTITPLAQKFKDLYDGGYLEGFSVGMLAARDAQERIRETGGVRYTKSLLMEITATGIPANALATVMKTFGKSFDASRILVEQLDSLQKQVSALSKTIEESVSRNISGDIVEGLRVSVVDMQKSLTEKLDAQEARLDGIEASIVATSAKTTPPTGDRNGESSLKAVEKIAEAVRQFAGR
jgi:hypothetical protein